MSDAMTYGEIRRLMDALTQAHDERDKAQSERQRAIDDALATSDAWWGEQCAELQRQLDESRAEAAHEREVANEHVARRHDAERERDEARMVIRGLESKIAEYEARAEANAEIANEARAELQRLRAKLADRDA